MSDTEKPEGNLEDADGVVTDGEGRLQLEMEVLSKGGRSDGGNGSSGWIFSGDGR